MLPGLPATLTTLLHVPAAGLVGARPRDRLAEAVGLPPPLTGAQDLPRLVHSMGPEAHPALQPLRQLHPGGQALHAEHTIHCTHVPEPLHVNVLTHAAFQARHTNRHAAFVVSQKDSVLNAVHAQSLYLKALTLQCAAACFALVEQTPAQQPPNHPGLTQASRHLASYGSEICV